MALQPGPFVSQSVAILALAIAGDQGGLLDRLRRGTAGQPSLDRDKPFRDIANRPTET